MTVDGADKTEPANYPGAGVDWDSLEPVPDGGGSPCCVRSNRQHCAVLLQPDGSGADRHDRQRCGGHPFDRPGTRHSASDDRRDARVRVARVTAHPGPPTAVCVRRRRGDFKRRAPAAVRRTLVEHFDALVDFQIFWRGRFSFPGITQFLQGRPSVLSLALGRIGIAARALDHAIRALRTGRDEALTTGDPERGPAMGVCDGAERGRRASGRASGSAP